MDIKGCDISQHTYVSISEHWCTTDPKLLKMECAYGLRLYVREGRLFMIAGELLRDVKVKLSDFCTCIGRDFTCNVKSGGYTLEMDMSGVSIRGNSNWTCTSSMQ